MGCVPRALAPDRARVDRVVDVVSTGQPSPDCSGSLGRRAIGETEGAKPRCSAPSGDRLVLLVQVLSRGV